MRIQLRAPGLALPACRSPSRLPSPTNPADSGRDPNLELHGRAPGWEARQRRVDHPVAQILTVGPCHARPPPTQDERLASLASDGNPHPTRRKLNVL